jgi:hypothetical protein
MNKVLIMASVVAAAATAACGPQPTTTGAGDTAADTQSLTVTLPAGDVGAGRQAFMDLRCTACHAVASEPDFPRPVSANPGPPIGPGMARSDPSYVATAIMTPSHAISPNISPEVRANIEDVLSPMGDYSHVMTVRQMVDLHAYVRSVK